MKEMTTTFFNRWKKGKVIEEYLVSGYSDGIQGRIVIVCEQMQENIIRLIYRKKTVGYIIAFSNEKTHYGATAPPAI